MAPEMLVVVKSHIYSETSRERPPKMQQKVVCHEGWSHMRGILNLIIQQSVGRMWSFMVGWSLTQGFTVVPTEHPLPYCHYDFLEELVLNSHEIKQTSILTC